MKYYQVEKNPHFVGRNYWWKHLQEIDSKNEASIIVIYGRRRVGKTELIEQFFRNRKILKFEGLQPNRKGKLSPQKEKKRQINECLRRLGKYTKKETEYKYLQIDEWSAFFEILLQYVLNNDVILYFEELQWLTNYQDSFLSELKPFWDDDLRKNPKLRIVISGSAPSFIVGQFMSNSAFYNRSENLIHLKPLNLIEINAFLSQKGPREVLLAALTTGGVCEYLKQIKDAPSIFTGLCKKSFEPYSFFSIECDKVFVSSLSENRHYRKIVEFLSKNKYADRNEIYKAVVPGKKKNEKVAPGGSFTVLLDDLERLGFISKYFPLTCTSDNSLLVRYCIDDEYLQFYFKFIKPKVRQINAEKFIHNPLSGMNNRSFSISMGFAFERWCRKNEIFLARMMNFGNVEYKAGAFFNRSTTSNMPGFQIDLMYIRKDHRIIVCEIKYHDVNIRSNLEKEITQKIELFREYNEKYKNYTFEKALITTEGLNEAQSRRDFFDYVITYDHLFDKANYFI
jgi:hypothetical protein